MNRLTSALGVLAVCLMLIGCGLDQHMQETVERAKTSMSETVSDLEDIASVVEAELATDAYASVRDEWTVRIQKARQAITEYEKHIAEAVRYAEKDDNDLRGRIMQTLRAGHTDRANARRELRAAQEFVRTVSALQENREQHVTTARRRLDGVSTSASSATRRELEATIDEFPAKRSTLEAHLTRLDDMIEEANALEQQLESKDIALVAVALRRAEVLANDFGSEANLARSRARQLHTSWTKTLTDMNILDTGNRVTFQHEYLYVRTDRQGNVTRDEKWEDVNERTFEQHQKHLGMAIAQKPRGNFDNEVVTTAQPPGYAYVAQPGENNQYGHWRTDSSGNSFWEFYGQYAFMRDIFWGSSYQPIYANDYRSYRDSYSNNRPYYGTSNGQARYGTQGTVTRTRYSDSRYRSSPNVRRYQQYRRSGGSSRSSGGFSNSRYSTTGTQRIQARQSSSSGSRSGGGK